MTAEILPCWLSDSLYFPPVEDAGPDGLLAIGGDLCIDRLLLAYRSGIFPWYAEGFPLLWWAPDPRTLLMPDELKVSASMGRIMRSGRFEITFDQAFRAVIEACGNPAANQIQTITVEDNTLPTASNPATINLQCFADIPESDTSVVIDEGDNCSTPAVTFYS